MTDNDDDLHDEIDELALDIEKKIQESRETLDELPEFDSKHRRMEEAEVPEPEEIFQ